MTDELEDYFTSHRIGKIEDTKVTIRDKMVKYLEEKQERFQWFFLLLLRFKLKSRNTTFSFINFRYNLL